MDRFLGLFVFALFGTVLLEATPPPVPSTGIIERELQKEYQAKPLEEEKEVPEIEIDIPKEHLEMPEGKAIRICHVEICGNEAISSEEICSWLESHLNCDLSMQGIYQLCQLIDEHYARKGYFLARAYPPPQEIKDETLVIEVLEGRLGNIKVEGNKYYTEKFICSYFEFLRSKPVRYDRFLSALILLNEISDLHAGAVFEKGTELGCADIIIRVEDARPIHLYLNGNNYGRDLTTNARVGDRLDAGNLFMQGDLFSLATVVGFPVNALYFLDASYSVPVNHKGGFLKTSYLFSKFKVEELTNLNLRGSSNIATLRYDQALLRTRSLSIDFLTYFDYMQFRNYVLNERTSFDKLRVFTVGALFDHFTSHQGRDYLILRAAAGIPDFLGGLHAVDSECSRVGGGGRFVIFNIDYDRLQHLRCDCYFYFHGSAQYSPYKLPIPEQFYIGGIGTVRGFPLAVALGDSGYCVNFELRMPPPFIGHKRFFKLNKTWKDIVQLDAFVDGGGVFLHSSSDTFLWGAGVGARVIGPWSFSLSIDVGFPLNHRDLTTGAFYYLKVVGQPF